MSEILQPFNSTYKWLCRSALPGVCRTFSPTGRLARLTAWVVFLIMALALVFTLPLCYAEAQLLQVAAEDYPPMARMVAKWVTGPTTEPLRIDHSAATIICLAVFFGVLVRVINYSRRFDTLDGMLRDLGEGAGNLSACRAQPELAPLLADVRPGLSDAEIEERVIRFHRNLAQQTRIRQHGGYLVALGLIGTMLAFYFGFAERLSPGLDYESLDSTARELLTVVGTAAISTVTGLVLGMLAVPVMSDRLARRRAFLVELGGEIVTLLARRVDGGSDSAGGVDGKKTPCRPASARRAAKRVGSIRKGTAE